MAAPKTSRPRRLPYVLRVIRAHPRLAGAIVLALVVMALLPSGWTVATPPVGSAGAVTASRATLSASAGPQVFTLVVHVNANVAASEALPRKRH